MKKIVFFILNNLEQHAESLKNVKKHAPFTTYILDFNKFRHKKYQTILKSQKITDILVVVHKNYWDQIEDSFNSYFNSIYNIPFRNIVYIYNDINCIKNPDILNGKRKAFFIDNKKDTNQLYGHLLLYLILQLNNTTLSYRLSDFMLHSFEDTVNAELLKKQRKEIEELNIKLEEKTRIDYLTNLYNRTALYEFLETETNRTKRDLWRIEKTLTPKENWLSVNHPKENFNNIPIGTLFDHFGTFAIMMIDLDDFKKVNDTHGHLAGDKVLKALGSLLSSEEILRKCDMAARFGGEEFIVVLPSTNSRNASGPAERISADFNKLKFVGKNERYFSVTLSIGISEYRAKDNSSDDIIRRADMALYYAKEHGKNKVIIYENVF